MAAILEWTVYLLSVLFRGGNIHDQHAVHGLKSPQKRTDNSKYGVEACLPG